MQHITNKNEKYIESRLGEHPADLVNFPRYFLLETIHACNAQCIMCPVKQAKKKRGQMSDQLFEKILQEIAEHRQTIKKVQLYLHGEPCLDRRLPDMIAKVRDAGIRMTNIASNASLLNKGLTEKILKAGLGQIYAAVDGVNDSTYAEIRKGLNLATVRQNLLDFLELRDQLNADTTLRVLMVVQEKNADEVDEWKTYWAAKLKPSDELVAINAHNWGTQLHDKVNSALQDDSEACIFPFGSMAIMADGTVPLCCVDVQPTYRLGRANKTSIAAIWKSRALRRIRHLHLSGKKWEMKICRGCDVWLGDKHMKI
jgi:radical SAM protein with 4Fe4S-binding SPASM domain